MEKNGKVYSKALKLIRLFSVLMFGMLFIGFGSVYSAKAVSKPELNVPRAEIKVGDKVSLSVSDAVGKIKWTSSKKSVASVSTKGVVTAKKPGTAVITASMGDIKLTQKITVTKTGIVLHMFDVGQGDAFLFQVNGRNILVDTGKESEYDLLLAQIKELDIKKIDTLILSHVDRDHIGAASDVISEFKVSTVYIPKTGKDTSDAKALYETITAKKVSVIYPSKDDEISFGYGATATILAIDSESDTNASSMVFRLDYYNNSFLMTGDAPAEIENKVLDEYDISDIGVLKVAHHGSDYSSPALYLKTVSPKYALISCGKDNSYGHPDKTVLKRLEKYADKIYRTDLDGHVVITGTGKKLSSKTAAVPQITDRSVSANDEKEEGTVTRSDDSMLKGIGVQYIGNLNSKIYHRTTCKTLPLEKNRIYFDSKEEAEAAGYRPCKNCKP